MRAQRGIPKVPVKSICRSVGLKRYFAVNNLFIINRRSLQGINSPLLRIRFTINQKRKNEADTASFFVK